MNTVTIQIIHPDTHLPVKIDAPVSKLKIPIDIFFDGEDVLIIRWKGATKRREILEKNEFNQLITKIKGRVWKFAGIALLTKEKTLQFSMPYNGHTIPDNVWNYSLGNGWRSNKACTGRRDSLQKLEVLHISCAY